jgi:hypothetical protein
MKSNLNKKEFKKRLVELTSEEKGIFLFTPYNSASTPFCGTYDDSTFELTRNSFWSHVKTLIIKGEYKELDENSTEVTYHIGSSRLNRIWVITAASIAVLGLNTIVVANWSNSDVFLSTLLGLNGFMLFAALWGITINWITKKIVNQRFKEEFEIGVEDEWERLAGTNV